VVRHLRPKGTPPEIVDNSMPRSTPCWPIQAQDALARPRRRSDADEPADFGKLVADETVKWAKVVKFAGLKVE